MQNNKAAKGGPKKPETLQLKSPLGAKVVINLAELNKAYLILRALRHPLRQSILKQLTGDGNKGLELTVTEIYNKQRIEQSVASQHLAILRNAGIVQTRREGKFIYYGVHAQNCTAINFCVSEFNLIQPTPKDTGEKE